MTKDEKYISRCLQLAYNGLCNTAPTIGLGAVLQSLLYITTPLLEKATTSVAERHMPK